MQESCPPPRTPPPSQKERGAVLGRRVRLRRIRSSLRSHSDLKVHWISGASPLASVVFPPVTEPRQDGVFKRVKAQSCEVKSQTIFVKRSAGTIGRNF